MDTISAPIAAYTTWLDQQPLALNTRRMYHAQVNQYGSYLLNHPPATGNIFSDPVVRDHAVRDYKTYLKTIQLVKPRTINLALAALDHFYRYLHMDPAHVRREDLPQQSPRALTPDEQKRLVHALEQWPSVRDRAVITLLLYTSLRAGERAALNLADVLVSTRRGHVIVREGKGNTYREVPLNAAVRSVLTQWLQERARRFPDTAELALFLTRQGQRFGVRAINLIVHGIGTSANVTFSAHTLRHTCLTNLVRQGNRYCPGRGISGTSTLGYHPPLYLAHRP